VIAYFSENFDSVMKKIFGTFLILMIAASCGEKSGHDHNHHAHEKDLGENEQLYRDVMRIHDEAMAKMDDIEMKKKSLTEQISNNADMPESEKQARQAMILKLDSAGEGMMDWMRKFDPPTDSSDVVLKTYLEKEMERVTTVRDNILSALEEAEKWSNTGVR